MRFWLSFVNETGFAGVAIVDAPDIAAAIKHCWDLDINPGGEVSASTIEDNFPIRPDEMNRLITSKEEATQLARRQLS